MSDLDVKEVCEITANWQSCKTQVFSWCFPEPSIAAVKTKFIERLEELRVGLRDLFQGYKELAPFVVPGYCPPTKDVKTKEYKRTDITPGGLVSMHKHCCWVSRAAD